MTAPRDPLPKAPPRQKAAPPSSSVAPTVAATVEPIAHSNWKNRVAYVFGVTGVLLGALFYAIAVDRHVTTVAGLLATLFVLFLIAPSAEQAVKMLATLAALRSGVSFASSSEVNQRDGMARSESTATPQTPGD